MKIITLSLTFHPWNSYGLLRLVLRIAVRNSYTPHSCLKRERIRKKTLFIQTTKQDWQQLTETFR